MLYNPYNLHQKKKEKEKLTSFAFLVFFTGLSEIFFKKKLSLSKQFKLCKMAILIFKL